MVRDEKMDGIKAVLIFLMVLGHLRYNDFNLHLTQIIYSFHMPAFVFLSGYFTTVQSEKRKRIKWISTTLVIYLAGQCAQCLYGVVLPFVVYGEFGSVNWKSLIGLLPCWTMWYVLSLLYWRIGIWLFHGKIKCSTMMILSCVVSVLSGCVPIGNFLSFQRTFVFMPMFVLGYMFKEKSLSIRLENIPLVYCLFLLPIGFTIAWYLPKFVPSVYYSCVVYDLPRRVVQCVLAVFLMFGVIRILYSLPIEMFARWGRYTLWVYIGHVIPLLFLDVMFHRLGFRLNVFCAIPIAASYVIVLTLAAEMYYRLKRGANGIRFKAG